MAHHSYTASERRGILAVAILALLLIGGGISLTLCGRESGSQEEIPVVVEHPEMIDSLRVKEEKNNKKNKSEKSSSTNKGKTKSKSQKTYRRRSPLDEPV